MHKADIQVFNYFMYIYQAYEDACQRGGMVDFAELLLRESNKKHDYTINDKIGLD